MEETKTNTNTVDRQTTDAAVILTLYQDIKELNQRIDYLESFYKRLIDLAKFLDEEEIEAAKSEYNNRRDVERKFITIKEIRKVIGLPEGICEEADRILREREEAADGEKTD